MSLVTVDDKPIAFTGTSDDFRFAAASCRVWYAAASLGPETKKQLRPGHQYSKSSEG